MYASNGVMSGAISMDIYSPDDVMLYSRPVSAINGGEDAGMAISNFHIQLDNADNLLRPGEEISGRVIMDVWSSLSIRFVEFLLQGRATVRIFKTGSKFKEQPAAEIYLEKAIHLITPPEGTRTVILTPGKYVTKFSYRLPDDLPPSVPQFDMGQGFVFDISYVAKANVAADISSKHISPTTTAHVVKIIKSTKKPFIVLPTHDWQSIPGALDPIAHAEQVTVCCSPFNSEPTSVLFKADQGVYPIGDIIKFQVEILSPKRKNVTGIMCELEQQIKYSGEKRRTFHQVLIKAFDNTKRNQHKMVRARFSMPLPPSLIPSFVPNCSMIKVTYFIKITVQLSGIGGRIIMQIPIIIAPPSGEDRTATDGTVPVFNKPIMQFPYFSKSPLDGVSKHSRDFDSISQGTNGGTMRSRHSLDRASYYSGYSSKSSKLKKRDPKVITRYVNGLGLCGCCGGCCGVGIHDA